MELRKGNSMTEAMLRDWGTQETTVGQLLEILMEIGRQDVIQEVMPGEIFIFFSEYIIKIQTLWAFHLGKHVTLHIK